MAAGKIAARTAAETLARVAEALRHVDDDETGIVPLVVASPAVAPAVTAAPVATPQVPVPRVPERAPARFGRRARLAGRGVQLAALGGAALTVAAASGLFLWASEDPGTPREAGVSDQTTPTRPVAPPVAVAPPGSSGPDGSGSSEASTSQDDDGEDTYVRETSSPSPDPITSDVTTLPAPPVVPPVVPPTVPPPDGARRRPPPPRGRRPGRPRRRPRPDQHHHDAGGAPQRGHPRHPRRALIPGARP